MARRATVGLAQLIALCHVDAASLATSAPADLDADTQRMLFVALSIFCVDGPPLPGKSTFLALRHLGFAPARILDVGANAGHWTRGILRVFPSASVVMVEANEARRQDWRGLPASVRGLISVLSDKEGEVPWFTTPGAATGDSMFQERTSWVATSNMTRHALTLDGLLAREGLADGPFGLVKLDVQGAELTVLRGAARALSQAEVLFMELPLVSARKRTRTSRGTYVHMLHGHAHAHMGSSTRARGIGGRTQRLSGHPAACAWPRVYLFWTFHNPTPARHSQAGSYNRGAPSFTESIAALSALGWVPFDIPEQHRLVDKREGTSFTIQVDFAFVRRGSRFWKRAQRSIGEFGARGMESMRVVELHNR